MEAFPVQTLKSRTEAFIAEDIEGQHPIDAESIATLPMERVKLEVDAMAVAAIALITDEITTDAMAETIAKKLQTTELDPRIHPLEPYTVEFDSVMHYLFRRKLAILSDSPHTSSFMDRIDHYRQRYYDLSPASDTFEGIYGSTESLLLAGVSTASQHFKILMHSIGVLATVRDLPKYEEYELARASSHLPAALAKLKLVELENYVDLLNEHDFLRYGLLKLHVSPTDAQKKVTVLDHRVIQKVKQHDKSTHDHRPHLQCPASVTLSGGNDRHEPRSSLGKLWEFYVAVLKQAGYWN